KVAPRLGQPQAPGRPVEQTYAEAILQARDLLADRRLGHAQAVGGVGEAVRLDHPGEDGDRGQMVHRIVSYWKQSYSIVVDYQTAVPDLSSLHRIHLIRGDRAMAKILVVYYSSYGHIETMADAVAEGARGVAGTTVTLKRVAELVPEEAAKKHHFKLDQAAPIAEP